VFSRFGSDSSGGQKKEVKTQRFSPPGVVGCCRQSLSSKAGLPCQAGLMLHSRDACRNAVRDLPPEGVSRRFVAPQFAHVNGKISLEYRYCDGLTL
jgi:hypothetical protein